MRITLIYNAEDRIKLYARLNVITGWRHLLDGVCSAPPYQTSVAAFQTPHDPDAPSRQYPKLREFRHWLVGNIPGGNASAGETLSAYVSPVPPPNTGLHRYVYLVYKQPSRLNFDESRLTNT
ncbi:unnamed protein product [Chilo suppressalis]|uniref:Phosphatidylethanolamine-binding protein n=1 Tax=Chilo suppressalis TaxID=168631 RepID=A0ABN8B9K7_CHISP|nr:unnamed protein product [Chilo suppressalis]